MKDIVANPSGWQAPSRAIQSLATLPATLAPDPSLLKYYALTSVLFGPFFVFAFIPLYFRYSTMRYHVDQEGITMRWGILFHREISLTYARIQDIHLSSNVVERWLGLGRIQVQTASGSASAEMTIEGLPQYQELRDVLYSRMRGARTRAGAAGAEEETSNPGRDDELASALRAIAGEVRALRESLPAARPAGMPRHLDSGLRRDDHGRPSDGGA